ncbi:helicase associated domain-containing protein [Pseudomonas oryzihabitans]|uniref:helicase associated domain-containing protein n=1 Tax=Pseudomonas oryzihabitans TaxID=47885 RepID=UPI003CFEC16B
MDPAEDSWRAHFDAAEQYVKQTGSTSIPVKHETSSGLKLGAWWSRQKTLARAGKLSSEKVARLAEIGLALGQ